MMPAQVPKDRSKSGQWAGAVLVGVELPETASVVASVAVASLGSELKFKADFRTENEEKPLNYG